MRHRVLRGSFAMIVSLFVLDQDFARLNNQINIALPYRCTMAEKRLTVLIGSTKIA